MPRIIAEDEIESLFSETKPLPANWEARLKPRLKSGECNGKRTLDVTGYDDSKFRIHVRKNELILLDFSLILMFIDTDDQGYTLTRFNGKHPSGHTNKWERNRQLPNSFFRNVFHIHKATERYQRDGLAIDGYAEPTTKYASFETALRAFVSGNGFEIDGSYSGLPLFNQ